MNKKINKKKRVDELQVGDKVILSVFFRGIEVSSEVKTVDRVSSIAVYVGKMRFNKKTGKMVGVTTALASLRPASEEEIKAYEKTE